MAPGRVLKLMLWNSKAIRPALAGMVRGPGSA